MIEKLLESVKFIKSKTDVRPRVGVILGSGLGKFGDTLKNATSISYSEIPNFSSTAVEGHKGQLILGTIDETPCAIFQGRVHAYEGYNLNDVVYSVRLLNLLGATKLILTNAAGGINKDYKPGDLIAIRDHINLTGKNPLIGKNNDELGPRFPDMTFAYNREMMTAIENSAMAANYNLRQGVYAAMTGPSYETPAEINMLRAIGADMVGMSTVFECIAANHLGMSVAGISCITNMAAGIEQVKLKHEDIKIEANKSIDHFCGIMSNTISKL